MKGAGAILLAAGQSSRFGSDKRQAMGDWGKPLLHHVLGLFRPHFVCLGVVIGVEDSFGTDACAQFSATALVNPEANLGMGRSLAVGIDWLRGQEVSCAVIGLADMPWIAPEIIATIAEQCLRSARLVVPRWQDELGFPRGIPAAYFDDLLNLSGDRGASARLDWTNAEIIEYDDPGVVRDIDRPTDIVR